MNRSEKQIAQAAERFAQRWEGRGYEKGESQLFWIELLTTHRDNDRAVHRRLQPPHHNIRKRSRLPPIHPLQLPHPTKQQ